MRRLFVVLVLPLLGMPLGCITSTGGPPSAASEDLRVDANDISRIRVLWARSYYPVVTLEAFVAPSGGATLVATQWGQGVGALRDTVPRIARDTLIAEEWASLIEIARADKVLAWRPYYAPPVLGGHGGGLLYTLGGDGWTLEASSGEMGFPGGAGFIRLAERLSALARSHGLEDELDYVAGFVDPLPSAEVAATNRFAAASDLLSISAGALSSGQDLSGLPPHRPYPLGNYVFIDPQARLVSVNRLAEGDSGWRNGDRQGISAAEWDAIAELIETERLIEWLPPKPKNQPADPSSALSPMLYWLRFMGPTWDRTVVVPARDAGVLGGLLRRMARLAEDRTSEAFPYFDVLAGL